MSDGTAPSTDPVVDLTVALVAAYMSNNRVHASEVSSLVAVVHAALAGLGGGELPVPAVAAEKPTPA